MDSKALIALEDKYGAHNYNPLDIVIERGEGVWVYDVDGKRYLDFLSAYSAVSQGHCHPRIVSALVSQAKRVTLASRAFRNDQLAWFEKEICEFSGFEMVLPMNTGAEAVETAIKAARKWGYQVKGIPENKAEIIVCDGNFHGRTTTIVGFSTEEQYKDGFGPFASGFKSIPFGDSDELRETINNNTAAFLVEPIQGEGGVLVPPDGYLRDVAEICCENNVLLIVDEIQTGLGRTGKLFGYEHDNIRPDAVVVGKALSGGMYPVSAVLASKELLGVFEPGDHGSTFGGNPLGAAIAREAIAVISDENLVERSAALGSYLKGRLERIESPYIKEVRGRGLFIGVELHPEAGGARRFCEMLAERGILCKETREHTIRFAPPLVIEKSEIDWAIKQVTDVLEG
ncbi:MAG: ornithine--oxo-acid transaminase [Chloroflexota bacterium]